MKENIKRDLALLLIHKPKIIIPVNVQGKNIQISIDVAKVIEELLLEHKKTVQVTFEHNNPIPFLDYEPK